VFYACCALQRWGIFPGKYLELSREERAFVAAFLDMERESESKNRR